jgi:hypothetical protein
MTKSKGTSSGMGNIIEYIRRLEKICAKNNEEIKKLKAFNEESASQEVF